MVRERSTSPFAGSHVNHSGAFATGRESADLTRPKALSPHKYFRSAGDGFTAMNHSHLVTPSLLDPSRRSAQRILSSADGRLQNARWKTCTGSVTVRDGASPLTDETERSGAGALLSRRQLNRQHARRMSDPP